MNKNFESETALTDSVVENLDLDQALQQQLHKLEDVESERLKVEQIERQLDRRDATVEELERTAEAEFDKLVKIRDAIQEREESDGFEADYESDAIESEDYDRLRALVERYEGMVAPLVIERAILLETVDELRELVDEQKLRHDESFVMEKVDETVSRQTQFMENTVDKMMDGFEKRMDRMIDSHERVLKREGLIQDGNGGGGESVSVELDDEQLEELEEEDEEGRPIYICPKCDDKEFGSKRGLETHLGQMHNME